MLSKKIAEIWLNYLGGQFLLTAFVSGLTYLSGKLTGLAWPGPNALVAAVCENIPTIGPVLSGVISGSIAWIKGSSVLNIPNWKFMLVTVAICVVIQLLENYLLSPLLIGKTVDIHPLIIFIGMAFFSAFFGFIGMILAVPLMATFRELIRYRFYHDDFYGDKK